MHEPVVVIVGCGYTGTRVAQQWLARGVHVLATTRDPARLNALAGQGVRVLSLDTQQPDTLRAFAAQVPVGAVVVHSLPPAQSGDAPYDPTAQLLDALGDRPGRMVYISSTGVYGQATHVDETTPVAPATETHRLRHAAELLVLGGGWPALVLRPAAIYGPWRGVHESIRKGRYRLAGDGANIISKIHVDDLAAHVTAACFASLTGAYPVADAHPSSARDVAAFCAGLLGLPMPPSQPREAMHETLRFSRSVDGRAIRHTLGLTLRYPSYREGIPAALAAESEEVNR